MGANVRSEGVYCVRASLGSLTLRPCPYVTAGWVRDADCRHTLRSRNRSVSLFADSSLVNGGRLEGRGVTGVRSQGQAGREEASGLLVIPVLNPPEVGRWSKNTNTLFLFLLSQKPSLSSDRRHPQRTRVVLHQPSTRLLRLLRPKLLFRSRSWFRRRSSLDLSESWFWKVRPPLAQRFWSLFMVKNQRKRWSPTRPSQMLKRTSQEPS